MPVLQFIISLLIQKCMKNSPPIGRNNGNKAISLAIRAKWLKQYIFFSKCL